MAGTMRAGTAHAALGLGAILGLLILASCENATFGDIAKALLEIRQGETLIKAGEAFDFGAAAVGSSRELAFSITNTGTLRLELSGEELVKVAGTDASLFSLATRPKTALEPAEVSAFSIVFQPESVGFKTATLGIRSNSAGGESFLFTLTAIALPASRPALGLRAGNTVVGAGGAITVQGTTVGTAVETVFTIENSGTVELSLDGSPTPVSLSSSVDFQLASQPLASLPPGGSTSFSLRFNPASTGTKSVTLTIPSNDADHDPFVFIASGTAEAAPAPVMGISLGQVVVSRGGSIDLGGVVAGGAAESGFTISNSGTAALNLTGSPNRVALSGTADFTVVSQPGGTVAAGGSASFSLRFAPSSAGAKSVVVTIANDDPARNPFTFTVTGSATASPEPEIALFSGGVPVTSGGSIDLGAAVANTSSVDLVLTIANQGSATLELNGSPNRVSVGGSNPTEFLIATPPPLSSLPAGGTTAFTIRFAPTSAGAKSALLAIPNTDTNENPYTVLVTGTASPAPAPEINLKYGGVSYASGQGLDIGATAVGSPKDTVITIENLGNANLALGSSPNYVGLSSTAEFQMADQPASPIAGGGSDTFTLRFNPTSAGGKAVVLTIASNDADESSYSLTVTGTGQVPDINLKQGTTNPIASGGSWNFGTVTEGEGVDLPFTIENLGAAPLNLTGSPRVQVTAGDFSLISQPTTPIGAPGAAGFTVRFQATATGTRNATLTIASNDPDEATYTVYLSGTGQEFHGTKLVSNESAYTGQSVGIAASGSNVYMAFFRFISVSAGAELKFAKSVNSGGTWSLSYLPLFVDYGTTYEADPTWKRVPVAADGQYVFFAANYGNNYVCIGYSSDYGETWQLKLTGGGDITDIAVDGSYVYIVSGEWNINVIRMPYNGSTYSTYTIDEADPLQLSEPAISVDSSYITILCAYGDAGHRDGVYCYRSSAPTPGTWTRTTVATTANPSTNTIGYATAVQASGSSIYAIYQYSGGYYCAVSTNGGTNWTTSSSLGTSGYGNTTYVSNGRWVDLVLSGGNLHLAYLGADSALNYMKSTNGGTSWSAAANVGGFGRCASAAVAGSKVYVAGFNMALYFGKSIDGGTSW